MARWTLPSGTTAQISAVTSPTEGEIAYDTTQDRMVVYSGGSWEPVSYGTVNLTAAGLTANQLMVTNASNAISSFEIDDNDIVTASGGLLTSGKVTTEHIMDDAVTFDKIQNVTAGNVLGVPASSSNGSVEEISISSLRGATITAGTTPPSNPVANELWFYCGAQAGDDARLYLYLNNVWVEASPPIISTGPEGPVGATGATGAAGQTGRSVGTIQSASSGGNITLSFYDTSNELISSTSFTIAVADGSITTAKLADDAVTAAKLDVSNGNGSDNQVLVSDGDGSMTWENIGSVHVGAGTVATSNLADGAVTNAKIADDTIAEVKLDIHNAPTDGHVLQYDDTNGMQWTAPATGATNISVTATGTSLSVNSSSGSNASIPAATTSFWGAMTDEDKTKLDGISTGADVTPSWVPASDPSYLTGIADDAVTYGKIDVASSTAGDVLSINSAGDNWEWTTPASGVTTLTGLSDTSVSSPADNQFLRYDGTNWVNETVAITDTTYTAGTGLSLSASNVFSLNAVHNSETHVYGTTALRNAATNVAWTRGDIALITGDSSAYIYTGTDLSTGAATTDSDWTTLTFTTTTATYAGQTAAGNYTVPVRDTGATTTKFLREDGDWVVPGGTTYTAGNGITLSSGAFSVDAHTGITVDSNGVSVTNPFTDADETKLDNIPTLPTGNGNTQTNILQTTGASGSETYSWGAIPAAASVADGAVDTDQLAADAVTNAKIADDAVSFEHIDVTSSTAGQVLTINSAGTDWEWTTPASGGATNLTGLSDVTISSPADDQFLRHNGTNWVNETVTIPAAFTVDGLTAATPVVGDSIAFADVSETNNDNRKVTITDLAPVLLGAGDLSELSDVHTATPTDGQVLTWDNTNSRWEPATSAAGASLTVSATAPTSPTLNDLWYDTDGSPDTDAPSQLYIYTTLSGTGNSAVNGWAATTPSPSLPGIPRDSGGESTLDAGNYQLNVDADGDLSWTAISAASLALNDLTDVSGTPTTGQVLTASVSGSTVTWAPATVSSSAPTYTTNASYNGTLTTSLVIPSAGRWQFMFTGHGSGYANSGNTVTPACSAGFSNIEGGFYDWDSFVFTGVSSDLKLTQIWKSRARWDSVNSQFRIAQSPAGATVDFLGNGTGLSTWSTQYSGTGTLANNQCMFGTATFLAESGTNITPYGVNQSSLENNTNTRGITRNGSVMTGELITSGGVTITLYGNSSGTALGNTNRPRATLIQIT